MIGIVGGVGPYAGLDLAKNVFDATVVQSDQDHLDMVLLSVSSTITDRTEYLMGREPTNPADALASVLIRLEAAGATLAGIPCNTAHADGIFQEILHILHEKDAKIRLLNMAEETIRHIKNAYPLVKQVGVLSTTGTYKFEIYAKPLREAGIDPIVTDLTTQEEIVHAAIYDRKYGIKAKSNPVTEKARTDLLEVARQLIADGAEVIIKGCTEIVLAVPELEVDGIPTVDPSIVLARRMVAIEAPDKLKKM